MDISIMAREDGNGGFKLWGEKEYLIELTRGECLKKGMLYVDYEKKCFSYDIDGKLRRAEKMLFEIQILYLFASDYYYQNRDKDELQNVEEFKIISREELEKNGIENATSLQKYITEDVEELNYFDGYGVAFLKNIKSRLYGFNTSM